MEIEATCGKKNRIDLVSRLPSVLLKIWSTLSFICWQALAIADSDLASSNFLINSGIALRTSSNSVPFPFSPNPLSAVLLHPRGAVHLQH